MKKTNKSGRWPRARAPRALGVKTGTAPTRHYIHILIYVPIDAATTNANNKAGTYRSAAMSPRKVCGAIPFCLFRLLLLHSTLWQDDDGRACYTRDGHCRHRARYRRRRRIPITRLVHILFARPPITVSRV